MYSVCFSEFHFEQASKRTLVQDIHPNRRSVSASGKATSVRLPWSRKKVWVSLTRTSLLTNQANWAWTGHVSQHVQTCSPLYSPGRNQNPVPKLLAERFRPDGFNVGINVGSAAGQTVMHCHIHLIPRRSGDSANPRGGVRGVIAARPIIHGRVKPDGPDKTNQTLELSKVVPNPKKTATERLK